MPGVEFMAAESMDMDILLYVQVASFNMLVYVCVCVSVWQRKIFQQWKLVKAYLYNTLC